MPSCEHSTGLSRVARLMLGAWSVAILSLGSCTDAQALPKCDVPHPPPACGNEEPAPPPPAPSMSLTRPLMAGGGFYTDTVLSLAVQPQGNDGTRVARLVIDTGPTSNGPWSGWHNAAIPASSPSPFGPHYPFYFASLRYTAPLPTTCFRAKFIATNGDYSPWSAAKCSSSAPVATWIWRLTRGSSATLYWFDNSSYDQTYYIETSDLDGSNAALQTVPGDGSTLGNRSVTVALPNRPAPICLRLWAVELLLGLTGYLPSGDLSDSSKLNSVIYPSPRICGDSV